MDIAGGPHGELEALLDVAALDEVLEACGLSKQRTTDHTACGGARMRCARREELWRVGVTE